MGLIVQLVIHCAVVLVATSLPHHPLPHSPQHYCDGWNAPPWCNIPLPSPTHTPLRLEYFCDAWCENPPNSGRRVCCEDIPQPQFRCPVDTRSPGNCYAAKQFGGHTGSRNPGANCRGVGGLSPDCPTGLFCCNDACGGPVCIRPISGEDATPQKINVPKPTTDVGQLNISTFQQNFSNIWSPCQSDHVYNRSRGRCVPRFTNTSPRPRYWAMRP